MQLLPEKHASSVPGQAHPEAKRSAGEGIRWIRPAFPVPGQTIRRALGKGEIFFGFAWHLKPPFGFRVQKERAAVLWPPAEVWNDLLI